ncbi:hypothetical protein TERTU_0467 [Teredinibacter turnerae T7901]|uniref:Uncharacterized protein n=1 Tax=Teredinibacter turnerae (strain ATCC 39867 / T7901) TaxID=377629 RepID=C5BMX7_TERTT|nr:hypothetical protein TERTU_0467 [Teredinibacter turnerae T7901]
MRQNLSPSFHLLFVLRNQRTFYFHPNFYFFLRRMVNVKTRKKFKKNRETLLSILSH